MIEKVECKQCGQCCKLYAIAVGYEDIMRWYSEGRYDILSELQWNNNELGKGYYIRSTLVTVNGIAKCSFLSNNNKCKIHDTKPLCCRNMPVKEPKFSFCKNYDNLNVEYQAIYRNEYNSLMKAILNKDKIDKILEECNMKLIESNFK